MGRSVGAKTRSTARASGKTPATELAVKKISAAAAKKVAAADRAGTVATPIGRTSEMLREIRARGAELTDSINNILVRLR